MSGDACSAGPTAATGTRALTDEEIREFLQKRNQMGSASAGDSSGPYMDEVGVLPKLDRIKVNKPYPLPPLTLQPQPATPIDPLARPLNPGLVGKEIAKRYRSVITGKMEEAYVPDPVISPDGSGLAPVTKPVSSYDHAAAEAKRKHANERMKNRTVSIERGMETGYADAMNGKKASMGALGSIDEWFAHGYRTGYARFEKEQS